MRLIILVLAASLAAEPALSQVLPAPADPRGGAQSESALVLKDAKELADCEGRWEAATHMTRKQWSQTCRRVLDRLRLLDLRGDALPTR
jgi:hypothetical protein